MTKRPAAQTETVADDDVREIEQIFAILEAGFNDKDAGVADSRFTSDTVLTTPAGEVVSGWDDLYAYHVERLTGPAADWHISIHVVSIVPVAPDVAVVRMKQDMTMSHGSFVNHGTAVMVKRNGNWWIAAMHNTNVEQ